MWCKEPQKFDKPLTDSDSDSPPFNFCLTNASLRRDCIYPVNIRETRVRVCVEALNEYIDENNNFPTEVYLKFYECMIALNVETVDDEFEDKEIRRSGKSFSRDYEMLTIEICFLGISTIDKHKVQYHDF